MAGTSAVMSTLSTIGGVRILSLCLTHLPVPHSRVCIARPWINSSWHVIPESVEREHYVRGTCQISAKCSVAKFWMRRIMALCRNIIGQDKMAYHLATVYRAVVGFGNPCHCLYRFGRQMSISDVELMSLSRPSQTCQLLHRV